MLNFILNPRLYVGLVMIKAFQNATRKRVKKSGANTTFSPAYLGQETFAVMRRNMHDHVSDAEHNYV